MAGRNIQMPRSIRGNVTPKAKDERIYAWPIVSQKTKVAGMAAKYTVLLWSHGGLTCDCPGWIFYHKKNGGCKHTDNVKDEAKEIFKAWERGEELPGQEQAPDAGTSVSGAASPSAPASKPKAMTDVNSKIKYGRFIEID
jgi:hypothetical protein